MTGSRVAAIRQVMGLEPFAFAAALGVHVSSVYRWERTTGEVPIDELWETILRELDARMHLPKKRWGDLGKKVQAGLVAKGTLGGMSVLLNFLVGDL